ncbi:MAG: hypothetical protein BWX58_00833 [Deltaproteobacteria bacterium ADurb.Bin026]|jgi:hypothetical protein|nr:hypothetical protein [Bacteroidales bacterium]OQC49099.1 MAG: hypothetical protein BWX58_00833 [Deltaproteobacteria bacterium ADurb.Bin026]
MAQFIRIKHYVINLDTLTYIRVEENHIDFGFTFPTQKQDGQNYIRLERGVNLDDAEFEEVKDFILELPDADRVILV